ncbi:hypothetical protein [Chitinimonas taiwanensis]|uniref:hypothetical protein n=1 Tax=Chitinimonas taiwanensis TaxID=240412 RepID=UPI0035B2E7C2
MFGLKNCAAFSRCLLVVMMIAGITACGTTGSNKVAEVDDEEKVEVLGSMIKRKPRDAYNSGVKIVSPEDVANSRTSGATTYSPPASTGK